MRIAHVVYECEPGRFIGGVQKMVYELAVAQSAQGDEVEIITFGDHPERRIDERLRIRYFPGVAQWDSRVIRDVLFKEHARFDVFHSHNTFLPLNRAVAATARRFNKKVFFSPHGALDPLLLAGWRRKALKKRFYNAFFERPNFNASRGVIGLTREECHQLHRFGVKVPIYEVANGIAAQPPSTPAEIQRFRAHIGVDASTPLILFVGRISPKKNVHHLVEAMLTVRITAPSARLVICGDRLMEPAYTTRLDALIAELQLADAILWAGFLDEAGKRGALGAARVFGHPSESEGMALAILEAMSFGVPAVVTPGCYMQRAAMAGAVVECQASPVAIGQAISNLLLDDSLHARVSTTAAIHAGREHSWPILARRLDAIYREQPDAAAVFLHNRDTRGTGRAMTTNPFMPEKLIHHERSQSRPARELFDSVATTWEDKYQEGGSMLHRKDRFCSVLGKHISPGGRLLDFGCASGDLTFTFKQAGYSVSGIDQAPAMIERAKARFASKGIEFKLLHPEVGGGLNMPFSDGEFSAIVASSVAEYLVPLPAYLREWHRIAAPGAMLLMTVPNPMHPLRWLESSEILLAQFSVNPFGRQSDRARYLRTSVNRSGASAWKKILADSGWTWIAGEGWSHPLLMIIAKKASLPSAR